MAHFFKVFLYQPLYNLLILLAWLIPGHSLGWSIIALTIIIRLILLPSSLKAAKAQARIQALQPQINEIRKNYKDQVEQSKALMELYKTEGVSQFGSCLPMLIQFPIMIALYQVFRGSIDTSHFSLLYSFVPRPESLNVFFFGLDIAKPELWVLPILAGILQYLLTRMTMPNIPLKEGETPDPTQMMMKQMNFIFPLMTVFFGRLLPAAASIYWVITTLFGVVQQWYVNKEIRPSMGSLTSQPQSERAQVRSESLSGQAEEQKNIKTEKREEKKQNLMTKAMNRRLEAQERKTGVSVTIRQKK